MPTNKDKTPIHEIFKIIYEESPDAIYLYDLEGNYLEGNPETERIVGYKKEELVGRNFIEMNIIPESEIQKAIQNVQDNAQGKISGPKEFTLIRKDGEKIIVEMRTYPFTFHGKLLIMGVARDITNRKKAEEKLVSSENRYRSIFENANDGIALHSIETGKIIDVNQNLCDLLKVSKEDCIEKNVSIFNEKIANFESDITLDWIVKAATDGPSIFEVLIRNFDNEEIWVEISLNLVTIDNEKIILSIVRNIHDRKIMENKLNALYQHSISLSETTTIEEISRVSLEIITNILGFTFSSFQLVEEEELVTVHYLDDKTLVHEEKRYLRLPINGKGITTKVAREKRSVLVNNTQGNPDYLVGTGGSSLSELAVPIKLDNYIVGVLNVESKKLNAFTVDDQHLLEILATHIAAAFERLNKIEDLERLVDERTEEIQLLEKRYQEIIKVTGNQAWEYDFKTNKIWVSGSVVIPELGEEFTVNLEDYLARQSASIIDEDRARVNAEISYALSEKTAFNTEYRVRTSEGLRWYRVTSSISKDEKGNPEKMLGISIDITDIKSMQEQLERQNIVLRELDDMKNRFISTISHELRTPITSFKGYLEIIDDKVEELPDDVQRYFEVLGRNTDRLITLTDDLLDQQRIQTGRLQITTEEVDITKILIDAVNEIKVLTDQKDIRIETEIQTDIPMIAADPVRIQQILVNLLHNAYKFSSDNTVIKTSIVLEQDSIHLTVKDNGIGLTEEQISLLFKPFPGIEHGMNIVGTGLGLSICRGLIELHGGKIWAESEGLGKGSSFHFILPVN